MLRALLTLFALLGALFVKSAEASHDQPWNEDSGGVLIGGNWTSLLLALLFLGFQFYLLAWWPRVLFGGIALLLIGATVAMHFGPTAGVVASGIVGIAWLLRRSRKASERSIGGDEKRGEANIPSPCERPKSPPTPEGDQIHIRPDVKRVLQLRHRFDREAQSSTKRPDATSRPPS